MLSDLSTRLAKAVMTLEPETLTEVIQIPLQERIAINDSLSFIYPIGYSLYRIEQGYTNNIKLSPL